MLTKQAKRPIKLLTVELTKVIKSRFGTKKKKLGAMEYAKVTVFALGRMAVCTLESGLKACAMVREPTLTLKAMYTKAIGKMIRCMEAGR